MEQVVRTRRDVLGNVQLSQLQRNVLAVLAITLCILFWWLITAVGFVGKVLLPPPLEVADAMVRSISDGSLVRHTGISLLRVIEGFLLALICAVPLGMLMGSSQVARALFEPIVELLRPIPPIAMIPLAILWFGIEELSKVLIIAYGAFFPILINTMAGFQSVDTTHIRAAQTLGASRLQIFRDVILRSAYPMIVVGARLGMGMAFIVLVAAELIASSAGLGYLINDGRYSFRTDQIFLGMVCIGILGFLLNKGLLEAERQLVKWKQVTH
jgi:ABC-type nitrate/sulfonate/bicarbonate transport system permease component